VILSNINKNSILRLGIGIALGQIPITIDELIIEVIKTEEHKMKKLAVLLAGAMLMMSTSAWALTIVNNAGSEANMQTVLNSITEGGKSSVNAYTDFIKDPSDAYWTTGGTGISSATMIIEIAGWSGVNTFGIYDSLNINNKATLFSGAAGGGAKMAFTFGDYSEFKTGANLLIQNMSNPTAASVLTHFDSQTFGFFLTNGNNPMQTFFSDTTKNADNYDHMVAYQGTGTDKVKIAPAKTYTPWLQNEFVLAFEDTFGGGDHDYNDLVLMVESVAPAVPEPGTMVLLGFGMLGLAIYGKRRMNREA
jgi:hypothetical protein